MSDESQTPRQVISLRTREAWLPPAKPKRRRTKVDEQSVKLLEDALDLARRGELLGLCIFGFDAKTKMPTTWFAFDPKEAPETAAVRAMGACEILKSHLHDVVEFGIDDLEENDIIDFEDLSS